MLPTNLPALRNGSRGGTSRARNSELRLPMQAGTLAGGRRYGSPLLRLYASTAAHDWRQACFGIPLG